MPLPLALRTCALLLKHAGTVSPAMVALLHTDPEFRDQRMLVAGKLGEVLTADQQILQDIQEIAENLLNRRLETPIDVLGLADELRASWKFNRMDDWLMLGRKLDLFTQRDIAAWAWLLGNWNIRNGPRPD